MKKMKSMLLLSTIAFLALIGCQKESHPTNPDIPTSNYDASVPLAWFKLAINMVKVTPGNTGPVQSRTFGYLGLSLYESVVPGMFANKSIQSQLNGLPALPKTDPKRNYYFQVSANAALANMMRHMFGNSSAAQNTTIDSLENAFNTALKVGLPGQDFDASVLFGQNISNAIYNWSTTDGGDKGYLAVTSPTYIPPVGPGLWVAQTGQVAQHPYWGGNRTFVAGNATSTQPVPPPAYSLDPTSQFYKDESEVYNESINQAPEHTTIAKYWAAIPPPTVSVSILISVLTDKKSSLSTAAEAFCKLGMAISDAFVSVYKTKYTYNQERPITFIQANFSATWVPVLGTPPFPDYTSAHSVQTGAAARVLADVFGDNTTFTDYSINDLGFTPRTFTKFSDYANEVGLSRIYGGIHNRTADFVGLDQGNKVGKNVDALQFEK
jgi:PAP2 superfamily